MPEYPLWDFAAQRPEHGHYVYRFHDNGGALLYVGSTGNVWERFGQHAGRLRPAWWPDVAWGLTVVELIGTARCTGKMYPLPEHQAMLQHEVALIKMLDPAHNKNSTGRCRSGRHQMTPENTYVQPGGGRTCKECRTERWANLPEEKRKWYGRNANKWAKAKREGLRGDELRAWDREYKQRADVRAKERARRNSPEGRAKSAAQQREYRNRPEVRERLNAQQRERRQRPAVQEKLREYAQKPEVRARKQEYRSRPEVNDRINVQQRERYAQRTGGESSTI